MAITLPIPHPFLSPSYPSSLLFLPPLFLFLFHFSSPSPFLALPSLSLCFSNTKKLFFFYVSECVFFFFNINFFRLAFKPNPAWYTFQNRWFGLGRCKVCFQNICSLRYNSAQLVFASRTTTTIPPGSLVKTTFQGEPYSLYAHSFFGYCITKVLYWILTSKIWHQWSSLSIGKHDATGILRWYNLCIISLFAKRVFQSCCT